MKKHLSAYLFYVVLFIAVLSLSSWGFLVHKTTQQLAIYELPKHLQRFFYGNEDSVVLNAVRPDVRRNTDKDENPKHFIDIEAYGENAIDSMPADFPSAIQKFSFDTLKKYGYVPYQILNEQQLLTNAFKQRNKDSIVFYATDLAHYIEDANVPLHTTKNYDGQLTGQKGMHNLWESGIPEIEISNYNLDAKHKAAYVADKNERIWQAIRKAYSLLPEMFAKEKEVSENFPGNSKYVDTVLYGHKTKVYSSAFAQQYAKALGSTINGQLINSANMVADFWYTAWVDAGKPNLKSLYEFTRTDKKALRKQLKAYRKNALIKDHLLKALQHK